MTDSTSATGNTAQIDASDPATARVDVQDPLPETSWLWRRIYVFMFSMISVAFIMYALESLHQMNNADGVYRIGRYMIGIHAILILFYMVAPSAEQIVKLIQAARIIREGVPITRTAIVQTPEGGRTEVSTSAGAIPPLPLPPAGGIGAAPEDANWK